MNRAQERAKEFNIIGVDFRLTQGVVKRIIPAVASTNAIIAGSCVLEALKLASNIGCPLDNYLNFSNIDGAFFGPVKLERKENCIVCSKSAIKIETSRSSLLKTFMDMLIEKYQLKEPSIRTAEHFIYIVNSLFPEAEKISKKNLEKSLKGLSFFCVLYRHQINVVVFLDFFYLFRN
jgi:ubiquitin-activating enzyme E1 C